MIVINAIREGDTLNTSYAISLGMNFIQSMIEALESKGYAVFSYAVGM